MVNKFSVFVLMMGLAVFSGCGDDNASGGGIQDAGTDSGLDARGDGGQALDARSDGGQGLDARGDGGQDLDAQPSPDAGTCSSDDDCAALAGPCHTASCDETTGTCQVETVADETPCDDGEACTKDDVCRDGECAGTTYDCDDGLNCTDDTCNGEGCDHEIQSGFCVIDGVCYGDGDLNPGNDCERCDASQPGAWSLVDVGSHCSEGDGPCTVGQCDGSGTCVPANVENFTDCDDGRVVTLGDWCYEGRCSGFEQQIVPSDSCSDEDKFTSAASASDAGIHALYLKGEPTILGACVMTLFVETLDGGMASDDQAVGSVSSGDTSAVWGNHLVVNQTLFSKVGSSWTSASTNGTLRKAWNGVSQNWNTRWVSIRSVDGGTFLGVGRKTDGTPLVRTCAYVCSGTGSCDWFCQNDNVSAQTDVSLVGIGVTDSSGAIPGGFRMSAAPGLQPIVDFRRNLVNYWVELADAGQAPGATLKDFIGVGDHVLGVGPGGLMVWGLPHTMEQICSSTFADYDLLQAVQFQGRLFVLYTKLLSGTQGGGRVFGVAHTNADADACDAWVFHDVIDYVDVGPVGPGNFSGDPDTWDYDYRVLAVDDDEMYLLGSWWDERSSSRAKSFLRWSIP